MDNLPTWVAIVIAIMTAISGGFGVWVLNIYQARNKQRLDEEEQKAKHDLDKNKQSTELRISENEQAFKIYKDLLDNLRQDVTKMTDDMNRLEKEHLACREENAGLKAEVRSNTREIEWLKAQLKMVPPTTNLIENPKS